MGWWKGYERVGDENFYSVLYISFDFILNLILFEFLILGYDIEKEKNLLTFETLDKDLYYIYFYEIK